MTTNYNTSRPTNLPSTIRNNCHISPDTAKPGGQSASCNTSHINSKQATQASTSRCKLRSATGHKPGLLLPGSDASPEILLKQLISPLLKQPYTPICLGMATAPAPAHPVHEAAKIRPAAIAYNLNTRRFQAQLRAYSHSCCCCWFHR